MIREQASVPMKAIGHGCLFSPLFAGNDAPPKRRTPWCRFLHEAWLQWDESTQTASVTDIYAFGQYVGRTAAIPQFDSFGDDSTANWTFGDVDEDGAHFVTYLSDILRGVGCEAEAEKYAEISDMVAEQVRLLSLYTFLRDGDAAPYIRIRMGTKDFFAPGVVSLNIAAALMAETDSTVDYAMLWDEGHNGDIGTDTWFDYIEAIVRE